MALKLFCNTCGKLIKEITADEASRISDKVICTSCRTFSRDLLDELNAEYQKLSQDLANRHNKAVLKLEETIRKALDD